MNTPIGGLDGGVKVTHTKLGVGYLELAFGLLEPLQGVRPIVASRLP